ncbi:Hsp70 family protein [Saccharomonospora piscinae]|uniref:Hsp70 family protein n=1 Tax=Saccharomonospora piscinae TaxID=687388 RepID=UPI001105C990|nr:Hsp70 family protein [Saccharomonospora piscinae]TLW93087.1 Hsp70 family protein [Saccharomonospora piscinae]
MRYVLGIHLGATRVSAAVCRHRGGRWWPAEVSPVGASTAWAESILHVSEQGDLLVGQAALQRAAAEPDRVARAPLHRTGDPVPFVLGELSYPAETLAAGMIGWVADRVAEAEAAHAERIVVTHPPGWSAYRRGLLHEALDAAELPGVLALPSPVAAAECHLAREDVPEIPPGQLLAVCAVGGVHVETALLRRTPVGVELLAHSESGEHGAGCRLDDLVVRHVLDRTGIDPGDPFAMSRLRMACIAAKERLATTTDAQVTDSVSLTRQEFEGLARPVLTGALEKLRRLASRVPPDQLGAALLVGGTARVPLAASLARTMLSCPVVVDDDPGTATSRGAALAARPRPRPGPGADARAEAGQAIEAPATDRAGGSATDTGSGSARGVDGVDRVGSVDTALVPDVGAGAALATSNTAGDVEPPPGRPPVEITPLEPPRRRFSLPRRGGTTDDRNEER